MADRIPLIISDNKLREIAAADNLKVGKLKPIATDTYDLGDSSVRFRNMYLDSSGMYLGGLILKDSGTELRITDAAGNNIPFGVTGVSFDSATGKVSVTNTDETTVTATIGGFSGMQDLTVTGATVLNGGLTMDTNAFTVADTTGNTSVGGTLDVSGITNFNDTTTSSSNTTGAVIVDGGLGLAENLNMGGDADVDGTLTVGGAVNIDDTTAATSNTTGALIVDGGVGIAGALHVGDLADIDGNLTVTGNTVLAGNLQVDGTQTIINSTSLSVNDKTIVVADSAADSSAANGAGLEVFAAGASILYDHSNAEWDFNRAINVTGGITASGTITGDVTGTASDARRLDSAGRAFAITGDATGSTSTDLGGGVSIAVSLADSSVASDELASAVTLNIKNSGGTAVKTLIGAGI